MSRASGHAGAGNHRRWTGAKDYRERYEELSGCSLWQCPVCHKGRMLAIEILPRNHSRQAAITDTYEEDCYEMQIKLLRASLAEPSGRSSVAKRVIPEKI